MRVDPDADAPPTLSHNRNNPDALLSPGRFKLQVRLSPSPIQCEWHAGSYENVTYNHLKNQSKF
jgi:hypothetical protein